MERRYVDAPDWRIRAKLRRGSNVNRASYLGANIDNGAVKNGPKRPFRWDLRVMPNQPAAPATGDPLTSRSPKITGNVEATCAPITSGHVPSENIASYETCARARRAGQTECLNILLQRCPDIEVDARNTLGFTPLMKAALQGRTKCAKILLFAGESERAQV
jgi:hypothetical protein